MPKVLIRIFIGVAFVFSGAVKLVPAEYLENDIIRSGLANDFVAPFLARFVIGSEFFIGIMLIFGLYRRLSIQLCLASLVVYTAYLIYIIVAFGNEGNCGCFGRQFELTPFEGIFKNALLGGMGMYLLLRPQNEIKSGWQLGITLLIAFLSLTSPYVIYKVDMPEMVVVNGAERKFVDFAPLYSGEAGEVPSFDIRHGKALVMFASLSCEHCRVAASKLELIKTIHPDWNIYIIYNGREELIVDFHKDAQIRNTPVFHFNDGESIARMVGVGFPVILLLEESSALAELNYPEILEENLQPFFTK